MVCGALALFLMVADARFGITHSLPFVADRIRLKVQVEAIRQDP